MVVTEINAEQMVMLFITVIAPLLVGLLTKASWSSNIKALLLLAISGAIGVAQGFLSAPLGQTWAWQVALFNAVIAYVIAVATHFGLWKPTGASDATQRMLVKDAPAGEHEMPAAA